MAKGAVAPFPRHGACNVTFYSLVNFLFGVLKCHFLTVTAALFVICQLLSFLFIMFCFIKTILLSLLWQYQNQYIVVHSLVYFYGYCCGVFILVGPVVLLTLLAKASFRAFHQCCDCLCTDWFCYLAGLLYKVQASRAV